MNLFAYFQVGRSALSASQAALDVAGNNIANVNTPGFSRRQVDFTTLFPQRVAGGYIGQGVDVVRLHRVRDNFLASQIQSGIGNRAGLQARQQTLSGLEAVLGPLDGSPLATALDRLAQSLSDVADTPENSGVRQTAVSAAGDLAAQLRSTHDQIQRAQQETDASITATVPEVNRLTSKIAALNDSIRQIQAAGQEPSDLLDQRGQAINELSDLVAIHLVRADDGSVNLDLAGGGGTLVSGSSSFNLTVDKAVGTGGLSSVILDIPGNRTDVSGRITGGRLGGLLASRDDVLATALTNLDDLATDLAGRFNAAQAAGFDLSGAPGGSFFTVSSVPGASAAGSIQVDAALAGDPGLLAAASSATPGDGLNAAALADIISTGSAALGGASPRSFFGDLLVKVGADMAGTDTRLASEGQFVAGLQAMSESISGVNLDEEAVSLIQFQRSFEAGARFINILDQITQVAVNLGR